MSAPSSQPIGLGQNLYDDAASLGRFKVLIILVLGGIISIILFLVGIYKILFSQNVYTLTTNAKVTQVTDCMKIQSQMDKNTWQYDCTTSVEYTIDNKKYQKTIKISRNYSMEIGNIIPIYYNPVDPSDIISEVPQSGGMLIGLSVFVMASAYLIYWLTNRFKFFAAAQGTSLITNLFTK